MEEEKGESYARTETAAVNQKRCKRAFAIVSTVNTKYLLRTKYC